MGCGTAYVTLPVMPEILEALELHHENNKLKFDEKTLLNNCSGYFIFLQAFGEMLGPTSSSLIQEKLEFKLT